SPATGVGIRLGVTLRSEFLRGMASAGVMPLRESVTPAGMSDLDAVTTEVGQWVDVRSVLRAGAYLKVEVRTADVARCAGVPDPVAALHLLADDHRQRGV